MRVRGFFALYSMFRLFEMVQRQRYYSQRNRQRTALRPAGRQVKPIQPMSDADIEKRYGRLSGRRVHSKRRWQHATPEAVRTAALFWLAVVVILLLLTVVVNMPIH